MANIIKRAIGALCAALLAASMPLAGAETLAPVQPDTQDITVPLATAEPVLADLSNGARGDEVLRLQQRLAVLGFFYTAEDGIYGGNTQNAVLEFENYLRLLEQDEIDRQIELNKTPEPTSTPEPTQAAPTAAETPDAEPIETPVVTPAPTPRTETDGLADVAMQEILFGDVNALYRRDAQSGDEGGDVLRLQRRLCYLNYLNDEPDGRFGINTENAIKAFQREHDLNATGIADQATQEQLYSETAIVAERPVYNQLYLWVSGEDVKTIQTQLRMLGFMTSSAGGTYDEKTQQAVMLLETYLYQMDQAEIDATAPAPTAAPTQADGSESGPTQAVAGLDDSADPGAGEPAFVPTGVMTAAMQERLLEEGIPVYAQTVQKGDRGEQAERVQRRLCVLGYLTAGGVDGIFGKGSENAVLSFQKRNALPETGIADQDTQAVLFSADAVKSIKPYQIKISVDKQRVYVYTHDTNDEYTVKVKEFICSTGTRSHPTPLGTFTNTGPGARWHYFKKFDCWAQYAYYIDGDIMFHSVLYDEQDVNTLRTGSVSALGSRASHGCVRLQVEDAQWIYNNCKAGTTVIVY